MKKMKEIKNILSINLKEIIKFEFAFKLITILVFAPLFLLGLNLTMKITGYTYLTIENILNFLINPITIVNLFIIIVLMTVYSLIDIGTLIILLDASKNKEKIKWFDAIKLMLKKTTKAYKPQNILLSVFILFLIPFLELGVSASLISSIKIPEFILDFIFDNYLLTGCYIIFTIILIVLFIRWIYSLNYFVLEDLSFKESIKKSIKLSKKHHHKDLLTLIVIQIIYSIICILIIALLIFLLTIIYLLLNKIILIESILSSFVYIIFALALIIMMLLSTPVSYATISMLFYEHKKENKEQVKKLKIKARNNQETHKKVLVTLFIIAVLFGSYFIYNFHTGKYNYNIEYVRTLETTGHRGASKYYPENTMSSFKAAKRQGADWIELDVQSTKDDKIIVIHDTNFARTTGVYKNTWEANYNEIKKLDAGSFKSKKFKGEKIPLLNEVVKFAKENNIKLNIELKPTGHEKNFEENVVDIIENYDFEDNCVITSQVYEVLENVKKYNKDVKTVYVMSIAYGDITSLEKADSFSIEESNVSKSFINKIHNEGKEVLVWTVNNKSSMEQMIDANVDNIITDNIPLAKRTILKSKTSTVAEEYIKIIEKIFE